MTDSPAGLAPGDRRYRRAVLALLLAGLATFNCLYSTQAILPSISAQLGASATATAGTVSAATGALALCIVPASILSERWGRNRILLTSALAATALGLIVPLAPNITTLIAMRAAQGAALAGVPAVAMTWLSEELAAHATAKAMGIYIAGTSLGGLIGRIIPALVAEVFPWRIALAAGSVSAFACALAMWRLLPPQRQFTPKQLTFRGEARAMAAHWRSPITASLFLLGFVAMGAFVSVFNYVGFELQHHYHLSEALTGCVFVLYLSGTISSARAGSLASRYGAHRVLMASMVLMLLGLRITLLPHLAWVIIGLLVFTAAFFAAHSTASGWLGVVAVHDRAEASSMYLLCYYTGSAVVGWASGLVFADGNWGRLGNVLSVLCVAGIALTLWASRHAAARHTASRHAASRHTASGHAAPRNAESRKTAPGHAESRHRQQLDPDAP